VSAQALLTGAWPWLAVAGVGALHGLNPAGGWMLAAVRGVRARDRTQALRALVPIAIGHVASVVAVAGVVVLGLGTDRRVLQAAALGLLVAVAAARLRGWAGAPARQAGLVLGSFMASTAHGTGLMLVPALMPLCLAGTPGRALTASGSLLPALAVVGVHMACMLGVSGVLATVACRAVDLGGRLRLTATRSGRAPRGSADSPPRTAAAARSSARGPRAA
jgi:hypothetical protein